MTTPLHVCVNELMEVKDVLKLMLVNHTLSDVEDEALEDIIDRIDDCLATPSVSEVVLEVEALYFADHTEDDKDEPEISYEDDLDGDMMDLLNAFAGIHPREV